MTVGLHPAGVPTRRPAGQFTPFRRQDYEVLVFWTRTGEVIATLPDETGWSYSEAVAWSSLGSMTVTVPVLGTRTTLGRSHRELLRSIEREGSGLSLCLVRTSDRRAMWAGFVVGVDAKDAYTITCASVGKLLDSRILIANDYWGLPNDQRGKLSFNLGTRDLVLELVKQGSTGNRRDLPLTIPAQSGATGPNTAYVPEDLVTVYEAIKKVVDRDDGPEVTIVPELHEVDDEAQRVRWIIDVGTPMVGTAASYVADQRVPTWDWNVGLIDLSYALDYSEMVSTGYVLGDSIGTTDRKRIIGSYFYDRGDPLPALERADRTNVSSTNILELNAQARSYVDMYRYPTSDWTISVSADRWPLLGSAWRLGDVACLDVRGHWTIEDGTYLRRIVGVKHDSKETLDLVTTDGSEIGLPGWRI